MKKNLIGLVILILVAVSAKAQEQTGAGAPAKNPEWGYQFKGIDYNYVIRTSASLSDTDIQLSSDYSFHPTWVNLTPGIEMDFSNPGLTRYFLQERINLSKYNSVVARMNHLQYERWEVGANFVNLYFQQIRPNLSWALGAVYIAQLLDDWRNPLNFNDDLYQLRMLYQVGYTWRFRQNKIDFSIGAENFTPYENYGYDQLGPNFQLGYQISQRTHLAAMADMRMVGLGTALPHLERETYSLMIDWRNLPKKPKTAQ